MKLFLIELLILAVVLLVLLAVVFRDRRARGMLRTLRNAAWLYIGAMALLALFELGRRAV